MSSFLCLSSWLWTRSALLAAFFALPVAAQLIPADRIYSWSPGVTVGVRGGIPKDRLIYTILTNIDNTGRTDVRPAIQGALNACPVGQVVLLPAGKFLVNGAITLVPGKTLRGAGMNLTTITNEGGLRLSADNNYGNRMPIGPPYYSIQVASGLTKGSTNFACTNTADFVVGKQVQIAQFVSTNQYDNPLVTHTGARSNPFNYLYRVIVRVTAKTATHVTFWPPLFGDMSARHAMAAWAYYTHTGIGLEDFTLELRRQTTYAGVELGCVADSWLKGVRIRGAKNYNLSIYDSSEVDVRECSIEDAGSGGINGAGLLLNGSCSLLVENNIFLRSYPSIEVNFGSCGNVFGYNFILNTNGYIEIDSNHGPHNAYNLYEGNIASRFLSDGYFGSESEGTLYRNWFHGTLPNTADVGYCISLKRFTRNYSIVGNIIGRGTPHVMSYNGKPHDGMFFGQPNMGNDSYVGFAPPWPEWNAPTGIYGFQQLDTGVSNTLFRAGNYNYFTKGIPPAETINPDALLPSLYRSTRPAWFGDLPWPPVDPLNVTNQSLSFASIPAGYRYSYGTNPVSALPEDSTAPTVPGNVSALVSSNRINLSWTPSTDNVGVIVYRLERSQGTGSLSFLEVATASGALASDPGLSPGTVYNYRVRAEDAAGNFSDYSPTVHVATPSEMPSPFNGLVAAYGFNESAGTAVVDSSGQRNTGTIIGAARTNLGRAGRALAFNGVDNLVLINPSPSLNLTSAMTLEAWVYPSIARQGWSAVLHREPDSFYLHVSSPQGSMLPVGGGLFGSSEQYINDSVPVPVSQWTHLATTYDGTTLRLYVNAVEVASRPVAGPISTNASPLRIGGNSYPNQFFDGLIDEVRVYRRALTAGEIAADMNTPLVNTIAKPTAPLGPRITAP